MNQSVSAHNLQTNIGQTISHSNLGYNDSSRELSRNDMARRDKSAVSFVNAKDGGTGGPPSHMIADSPNEFMQGRKMSNINI